MRASARLSWILSIGWLLLLALAVGGRLTFPLELEWMEGGTLHQAQRLLDGEPVYAEPSVEFVPFLYTPLYPALVAAVGAVFGLDYVAARAVSIVSLAFALWAMWTAVRQETRGVPGSAWVAWLAPGLMASGYVFTFRWLDVGRGDATFLALTMWGLVWLRRGTRAEIDAPGASRARFIAAACLAAAFWAKQTAALFIVAAGVWGLWVSWRVALELVAIIGVIDGVGVLLGQLWTEGWLWTYIYELHQNHAFNRVRFTRKTWGMFVHAAPWLVMLTSAELGLWLRRELHRRRGQGPGALGDVGREPRTRGHNALAFWGLALAAAMLASALGYSTQWAEPNAFVPGVAVGSVWVTLWVARGERRSTQLRELGPGLVSAQLLFALVLEPTYQPIQDRGVRGLSESYRWQSWSRTVPDAATRARAAELRGELERRQAAGRSLFAPQRPWWGWLGPPTVDGARGHVGSMGLNDIPKAQRARVRASLRAQLEAGRWDDLWFEGNLGSWWWLRPTLARHYRLVQRREGSARVRPMVGYMSEAGMVSAYEAPQLMFERVSAPVEEPRTLRLLDFEDRRHPARSTSGEAFGRGPVASVHAKLPAVGPISGSRLISSAAGRRGERDRGRYLSPGFELPRDGVELLWRAAWVGPDQANGALEATLVDEAGARLELPWPGRGWTLGEGRRAIPQSWRGRRVRLELRDASKAGALMFDDLRVLRAR